MTFEEQNQMQNQLQTPPAAPHSALLSFVVAGLAGWEVGQMIGRGWERSPFWTLVVLALVATPIVIFIVLCVQANSAIGFPPNS
jgi:cation transporter-like permease